MLFKAISRLPLLIVLAAGLVACQQQEPKTTGTVKVNQLYRTYFGEAPVPGKGICFARIGFYPLRDDKGKLAPIPLFLFKEEGQLALLLGRQVSNEPELLEYGPLYNPFPEGSKVDIVSRQDGLLQLVLSLPGNYAGDLDAMAGVLTETALQFDDIQRVSISVNGTPLPGMPEGGYVHNAGRIVAPGAPEVLLVVGAWEAGATDPGEILADFDRPVKVKSFELRDSSGGKIEGDYFTSAFDMAVVIHPANPQSIQEGMELTAKWSVTDALGRTGEGGKTFRLIRHEHPDSL